MWKIGQSLDKIGKPGNFEEFHFFPVSAPENIINMSKTSALPYEFATACLDITDFQSDQLDNNSRSLVQPADFKHSSALEPLRLHSTFIVFFNIFISGFFYTYTNSIYYLKTIFVYNKYQLILCVDWYKKKFFMVVLKDFFIVLFVSNVFLWFGKKNYCCFIFQCIQETIIVYLPEPNLKKKIFSLSKY